jgi:hypothetical protein
MSFPRYKNRVSRALFRDVIRRNCPEFFRLSRDRRGAALAKMGTEWVELYDNKTREVWLAIHKEPVGRDVSILGETMTQEGAWRYCVHLARGSGAANLMCRYLVCDTLEEACELLDAEIPDGNRPVPVKKQSVILGMPKPSPPAPADDYSGRMRAIQRQFERRKQ